MTRPRVPLPPGTDLATWPELTLLAACVWAEARGEVYEGRVAVACVVLERTFRGGWFGRDMADVLLRDNDKDGLPDQFSCFRPVAKQGQLEKLCDPLAHGGEELWVACWQVASGVRFGWTRSRVANATHYVATTIAPPSWTTKLTPMGQIGRHVFFREDPPPRNPVTPT